MNEFEKLKMEVEQLRAILDFFVRSDRYYFQRDLELADTINIRFSGITGTKIGTTSAQKLGLWGVTPVDQPETVADPTGGANIDAEARTAIIALIDRNQEVGIIK